MFKGYGFFDYKYNIPGYSGQDFDGPGRIIYLVASIVLIIALCFLLRKAKEKTIRTYLKVLGIFMVAFYLSKTIWESYYDITTGRGFNEGLLPFDTCSLIMPAAILAGFAKGKTKKAAECWLATGGVVGGISNMLFLQALKYYPFFTFAALYSMLWHFLMVFTGVWLLVTNYVKSDFKSLLYGYAFHVIISIPIIPAAHIRNVDFMLYRSAGGVPLIGTLGDYFLEHNIQFLTTVIMLPVYFMTFAIIIYTSLGIKKLVGLLPPFRGEPPQPEKPA